MGYFYFDESIHERANFIIGAFVYSDRSLESRVENALTGLGLRPGVDEFKSGARMDSEPHQKRLRAVMRNLLMKTRLGLLVMPVEERTNLGIEAVRALEKIILANKLDGDHTVYLDQGIKVPEKLDGVISSKVIEHCKFQPSQLSHQIGGIQLADLAAHTFSIMLLETLGELNKMVKAGPNSGYDPDLDIELGFEMWATVRYQFFTLDNIDMNKLESGDADIVEAFTLDIGSYALYVANSCSEVLRSAANNRFGTNYIGCIH